jgi:FKBP-type peptidyl-prolyl cis-trans isomerase FklB
MEKVSYALGLSIGNNVLSSGIENLDIVRFTKGMTDVLAAKTPEISEDEAQLIISTFFEQLQQKKYEANIAEGKNFLEQNKQKAGVVTLASGLQYEIITDATGAKPSASDSVKCHYHGTLIDGTVFDSSVQRGDPATFGVSQVIKGWVEALQLMSVGAKWRLFIPSDLAYGAQGAGQHIAPHTALIFEVELLEII